MPIENINELIIGFIGSLFIILSESLPFIKNVKANGVIELIYNTFQKESANILTDIVTDIEQIQPLLTNQQHNNVTIVDYTHHLQELNNVLNFTSNLFQESRQLKLQTSELYELNYIISYIKLNYPKKCYKTNFLSKANKQLFISQGYVIDYDSEHSIYSIKW